MFPFLLILILNLSSFSEYSSFSGIQFKVTCLSDLFKKVKKVCNAKMRDKNDNKHFYDVKKQDAKKVKVKQEEKWYDRYR